MMKRDFIKLGTASAFAAPFTSIAATAQGGEEMITIRWLGGATMEIEIGELRFLTDPCFGEGPEAFLMADPNEQFDPAKGPPEKPHARFTAFPGLSMDQFDAVLLSHAHEDHFDRAAQDWLQDRMPLICPTHDARQLIDDGLDAQPLSHLQKQVVERNNSRVEITAIPAIHSLNPDVAGFLGEGNGYFLQATVGKKELNIYWAGDTFMVDAVERAISDLPAPDLFIPHVGAVGMNGTLGQLSLNGEQAVLGAQMIGAKNILPIHHSTFSIYQEPVGAVTAAHAKVASRFDLTVLDEGAALQL